MLLMFNAFINVQISRKDVVKSKLNNIVPIKAFISMFNDLMKGV